MDEITQNQRRIALEQAVAFLHPMMVRQTVAPTEVTRYAKEFEAFLARPAGDPE